MKARYRLLALLAVFALVAPGAFAQGPTPIDSALEKANDITSRVYTNAILTSPSGQRVGKAGTASIVSESRGLLQTLRIQVSGLTPGADYALVIDNTLVVTAAANSHGVLRVKFASPASGRLAPIPEAIAPISTVSTIQIFAVSDNQLVASGQFRGKTTT